MRWPGFEIYHSNMTCLRDLYAKQLLMLFRKIRGAKCKYIHCFIYIYIYTSSQRQHYFQALVVSVHGFQWRCVKTGGELTDGQSNEVAKGSHQRKEAYLGGGEPDPSQTEEAMELCQVHS